jgi:pimeloyl-ACP methyl ester carboxylesterase
MAPDGSARPQQADTQRGKVQYEDEGTGDPVLFIHGSPGGCDQGALMTQFLRDAGRRVIALSRPGYLDTPLTDDNKTPEAQASLALELMDALGLDKFALMCWSGGGPSSYTLAARHPERVTALAAVAAVSGPFEFHGVGEEKMLMGRFGAWLAKEMVRHAPKETVKSLVKEEGDLSKAQAKELAAKIWEAPEKRAFALALMETVSGDRKVGFENDVDQFQDPSLDLAAVRAPVLLVHAATDGDVPVAQSEHASDALPSSQFVRLDEGTHVSVWTDPGSESIQARITAFLAR